MSPVGSLAAPCELEPSVRTAFDRSLARLVEAPKAERLGPTSHHGWTTPTQIRRARRPTRDRSCRSKGSSDDLR
jgi:hypothetical protein